MPEHRAAACGAGSLPSFPSNRRGNTALADGTRSNAIPISVDARYWRTAPPSRSVNRHNYVSVTFPRPGARSEAQRSAAYARSPVTPPSPIGEPAGYRARNGSRLAPRRTSEAAVPAHAIVCAIESRRFCERVTASCESYQLAGYDGVKKRRNNQL